MCNEVKKTMEQLLKYDYKDTLLTDMKSKIETTVEPPVATTSRKRLPLLNDQVCKSNYRYYLYLERLASNHLS